MTHLHLRLFGVVAASAALPLAASFAPHETNSRGPLFSRLGGLRSSQVRDMSTAVPRTTSTPPPPPPAASPVVVCGPSGAGKGTLIKALLEVYPEYFGFAVSHTTRAPREGEVHGKDYFFQSRDEILASINRNEFIEHAEVHGNIYGTSCAATDLVLQAGRICILDIDVQGVRSLQRRQSELGLSPHYLFICPPSVGTLESRLRMRNTESEEQILRRIKMATEEMTWGTESGAFERILVNDVLDDTKRHLLSVVRSWYPHLPFRDYGV